MKKFYRIFADRLPRPAAQRDALGTDDAGHRHRRGGRHRHDRDRPGFQRGRAENHRQHGGQQPAGHARHRLERRRHLRQRQRHHAHAAGRRRHRPRVPGRQQRGHRGPRPHPGDLRQQELGAVVHLRHHARRSWTCASGPTWRKASLFTDADVRNQTRVCLIGQTIKRELFNDQSPMGREIRMQNVGFRVIGVLELRGRQHDGPGPGRHHPGPVDEHQGPRQQQRADQRQPEHRARPRHDRHRPRSTPPPRSTR